MPKTTFHLRIFSVLWLMTQYLNAVPLANPTTGNSQYLNFTSLFSFDWNLSRTTQSGNSHATVQVKSRDRGRLYVIVKLFEDDGKHCGPVHRPREFRLLLLEGRLKWCIVPEQRVAF